MNELVNAPSGVEATLLHDGGAEYSLTPGASGCWITVDSLSVSLRRDGERLVVEVFPLHQENQSAIATLEAENQRGFD